MLNAERIRRLMEGTVEEFDLDLSGLTVITEVGTGYFALTPVIAASAGADVLAAVPADRWDVLGAVADMACYERPMNPSGKIFLHPRAGVPWGRADIVTNVGNVRPIDGMTISEMSSTAVVSLMCEAWEVRSGDVDVPLLVEKGIPVLATDEGPLGIWDYCGPLALKMLLEKGIEIHKSRILVLGKDKFAVSAFRCMAKASLDVEWSPVNQDVDWEDVDAVVVSNWAGSAQREGIPTGVEVVCLAERRRMTRTLAYLGPRPVIELHAAGLKIGELLARAVKRGLTGSEAENFVLSECAFSQRAAYNE